MLKPPTEQTIAEIPMIPVPQTVLDRALKRMQSLCKGNGVKADDVVFKESKAQIYELPARTLVRITSQVETKTVAGKITKGEMIGSPEQFQSALQGLINSATADGTTRQTIIDAVLARPDKGFSARDQKMLFPHMAREFVSHETCSACAGKGKNTCHACSGKAQVTCGTCQGRTHINCPNCRSTGHIMQNDKRVPCPRCQTRGRIACPACAARGMIACQTCKGGGEITCARCTGTGALSHIAIVNIEGNLHFDFERQGLPLQVGKRIDAFGARHAALKDFMVTPLTGSAPLNEQAGIVAIDYAVKIPHGKITFGLKDKNVTCTMLGYRGEILDAPPFLHEMTRAGQNALIAAADMPAKTKEGLRFAARFRLLRDVILLAAKNTDQRGAITTLHKKYPFGVAADQLLLWFVSAQNAVRHLTRRPRWIGLAAGATLFAGLLTTYLFTPLRVSLLLHLPAHPALWAACDFTGWLVGFWVTSLAAHQFASRQIQSTLGGIVPDDVLATLFPERGRTNLYAAGLSCFVFLLVYGLAFSAARLPEYAALFAAY